MHLSQNRRESQNGVTIDTVLIKGNIEENASNCCFFSFFFNVKHLRCHLHFKICVSSTVSV